MQFKNLGGGLSDQTALKS